MVLFKKNTYLLIGILFILSIFLSACSENSEQVPNKGENKEETVENEKIVVYTSFYPLYDITSKIAGNRAEVINLVPPGAEAHDFEPTPKDLVKLSEADMFIYNGSGFELWIEDVLNALDTSEMAVLSTTEKVTLLTREETGSVEGEEEGSEEAEEEGIYDPHIWLDPILMKDVAAVIKEEMIKIDNGGQETYEANFNSVINELDKLDQEYQEVVKNAKQKEVIVSHDAYGYLMKRYGIKQIPISGLSPSDEPSQKELQEIITFAKEQEINYILFETLVNLKVAEMVREQIGAEALTFNPIEGLTKEELAEGKDYFSVMRDNLNALKIALGSE